MPITASEARAALAEIDDAEGRGRAAHSYRATGGVLILWGAIWILGYTAMGALPVRDLLWVWTPANLIGAAGTILLLRHGAKTTNSYWLGWVAAMVFLVALYLVDPPQTAVQGAALPPLLVAFLYCLLGLGRRGRFAVIGATLFAATLFGVFVLPGIFAFWMAATGGAALLIGGLWLRRA
jgi:hypothetical protein